MMFTREDIESPMPSTDTQTMFMDGVLKMVEPAHPSDLPLILDPPYQRGRVWTDEQAEAFVGALIAGVSMPPVFIRRDRSFQVPDEVLDGKQRITAMCRFMKGEISAVNPFTGLRYRYEDLDIVAQRLVRFTGITVKFVNLKTLSDCAKFYVTLNSAGTPHTSEEIDRVKAMIS